MPTRSSEWPGWQADFKVPATVGVQLAVKEAAFESWAVGWLIAASAQPVSHKARPRHIEIVMVDFTCLLDAEAA